MALSDQLAKLSDKLGTLTVRAKEAEARAAAARSEASAKLENDVQNAHDALRTQANQLREKGDATQGTVANWWSGVQKGWDDQVSAIRHNIDSARAEHKVHAAERAAISAEEDAEFAIGYAHWAIEQAEYAVLEATLARKEADSLVAAES